LFFCFQLINRHEQKEQAGTPYSILGVKAMLLLKMVADERHLNLDVTKRAREVLPQLSIF
jgi:hypothetical protein